MKKYDEETIKWLEERSKMKYKFSTIEKITGEWSYERKTMAEYIGKYMCQVFDKNDKYVKVLAGNTYEEVRQMQKEMNK